MIDRSVEVTTTAVSELRSSSAAGGPFGPSRPQSMITSRSTSPSRSKASAVFPDPTKMHCTAWLVKPGRKSRRLSSSADRAVSGRGPLPEVDDGHDAPRPRAAGLCLLLSDLQGSRPGWPDALLDRNLRARSGAAR